MMSKTVELFFQILANSVIAAGLYAVIALGFNLIYGTVKFFDLGYGALAAVGGYGAFFIIRRLDLDLFWGIAGGVLAAGALGGLLYLLIYRPIRSRKASNMVLLVASLGAFTAIQAIIAITFTSQFQTLLSGGRRLFHFASATITDVQLAIIITAFVLTGAVYALLKLTRFGRAVVAIGDDEEVAKIVGINTTKVIGWIFVIGSAIGGLAGIMVGLDTGIEPTMGLTLLLKGVIAAIVGGVGHIWGGLAGAFVLGFAENFGIWRISGEWKDAIAFTLLIIVLLFRPRGIFRR